MRDIGCLLLHGSDFWLLLAYDVLLLSCVVYLLFKVFVIHLVVPHTLQYVRLLEVSESSILTSWEREAGTCCLD